MTAPRPRRRPVKLAPRFPFEHHEPKDVRRRHRQLKIGEGSVTELGPELPRSVTSAIASVQGPDRCLYLWCESDPTWGPYCETHAAESQAEVHRAIERIAVTSFLRRSKLAPDQVASTRG